MSLVPCIKLAFYHKCDDTKEFMHQIAFFLQHSTDILKQIIAILIENEIGHKRRNQYPCYSLPENPSRTGDIEKIESSLVFRLGLILHQLLTSRPYQYYVHSNTKNLRIEKMYISINDPELNNLPNLIQAMLSENPNNRPTLEQIKQNFKFDFQEEPQFIFNILYHLQCRNYLEKLILEEGLMIVKYFESLQE